MLLGTAINQGVTHSAGFSHSRLPSSLLGTKTVASTSLRNSCKSVPQATTQSNKQTTMVFRSESTNQPLADPRLNRVRNTPTSAVDSAACDRGTHVCSSRLAPAHIPLQSVSPYQSKQQPVVNTKPRTSYKLYDMYSTFLSWDPARLLHPERDTDGRAIRPSPNWPLRTALPNAFSCYDEYVQTFVPLLLTEMWDTVSAMVITIIC